jgi:glycine cleavage system H protein
MPLHCGYSLRWQSGFGFPSIIFLKSFQEFFMSIKYTPDHEWLSVEGDTATVGITHHAQDALGDVVFVDLPEVGKTWTPRKSCRVVESVKAAADVYMPVSGEITEVNEALRATHHWPTPTRWARAGSSRSSCPTLPKLDALMDETSYTAFSAG